MTSKDDRGELAETVPTVKRPKVRIGTLMFLIVIVALTVALGLERRRSAMLMVEVERGRAMQQEALMQAERARYAEQIARAAQLASQVEMARPKTDAAEEAAGAKPR